MRERTPERQERRMNIGDKVAQNNGSATFMPPPFQLKGAEGEDPLLAAKRRKGEENSIQENEEQTASYLGEYFKISSQKGEAVVRDASFNPIKYAKGDEIPEGKKEGESKIISQGLSVKITAHKVVGGKLKYVNVEGYGWTSVTNIKGGLANHSLSTVSAASYVSQEPNHKTIQSPKTYLYNQGKSYNEVKPLDVLTKGTFVSKISASTDGKFLKVQSGSKVVWTSVGNLATKPNDEGEYQVIDGDARIRSESEGFTKSSSKLAMKSFVIVKETEVVGKNTYYKIAKTKKENEHHIEDTSQGDMWIHSKDAADGWSDITGNTAMWKEQENHPKEGQFLGQADVLEIVGTGGYLKKLTINGFSNYQKMVEAASGDGVNIRLNSGFRNYGEQKRLRDLYLSNTSKYNGANRPGTSDHQNGIAYDLNNKRDVAVNKWLKENAYMYGFAKTYKGYKEHHHWEYVPDKVKNPETVEKDGKNFNRIYFSTFEHEEKDYRRAYMDVEILDDTEKEEK